MSRKQASLNQTFFNKYRRVLVTGGAGFIGGAVVRRLLDFQKLVVYNLDKLSYSSDLYSINQKLKFLGSDSDKKYNFLKADLCDEKILQDAFEKANPDLILNLAAESHVDRSIDNPRIFIDSNIVGTFNLLQVSLRHFNKLSPTRKKHFRFHHISTDEVFGSLDKDAFFSEETKYDPRSPYSASKAASDHLVNAWHNTYGLPISITNCSNNYGPWQFPEKLIPLIILKGMEGKKIPLYGDGTNQRDWLYVEDHVEAILATTFYGNIGKAYCVGGRNQLSNLTVAESICELLDKYLEKEFSHNTLISFVKDRPGHDKRYAINPNLIAEEIGWMPKLNFEDGLKKTVSWYLNNKLWCERILRESGYEGQRIGKLE